MAAEKQTNLAEKQPLSVSEDLESRSSLSSPGIDADARDMEELEAGTEAMVRKMKLVNDTLDEIGFTWFQMKYFVIAGWGYCADSLLGMAQSTVSIFVNYQYRQDYPVATEFLYVGLMLGCIFWGLSADIIGRKLAFNISLLGSAVMGFFVGGSGSIAMYCIFLTLSMFFLGGNLAIDATVFLEFLPTRYTWLVTLFASWWSIGQIVGYIVAYIFVTDSRFTCDGPENCQSHENRGWRYVWYVDSAIVLVFGIVRLMLTLDETPKYLVVNNRDEEAYLLLKRVAEKYNRPFSLTLEQLQACGTVHENAFNEKEKKTVKAFLMTAFHNSKSLFRTKKIGYNTLLLCLSWAGIGLAYPLYGIFLPQYLQAKGAETDAGTPKGIYRDSLIAVAVSTAGPIIGGFLCITPWVGRKGTLFIGGVATMAFLMAFTSVDNRAQNIAFNSISYLTFYIYYACLYAFTPEVLPSYCRTTGAGLTFVCNRVMGLIVPVVAYYANTATSAPIFVCAACVGLIGCVGLLFPFEPRKLRSV